MKQYGMMTKDYDGLVFDPFGDDDYSNTPKPRKKSKKYHPTKRRLKSPTTDPFSNNAGLVFDPFENDSNSTPKDDFTLDGIVEAGMNIKNTIDAVKTFRDNRRNIPHDPDHIIQRAKNIKAREKKKRDVAKAREYIEDQNAIRDRKEAHAIFDKYGYIKGREILYNRSLSTSQRLRKFLKK